MAVTFLSLPKPFSRTCTNHKIMGLKAFRLSTPSNCH